MTQTTQHRWASLTLAAILAAGLCGAGPRALAATASEKCEAAKVKAAGQKVFDKAKCQQKALQKSLAIDPLCLSKAEVKFAKAIAKADTIGTCDGTASGIEADVDACVADLVDDILTTTTSTSTTTTTLAQCGSGVEVGGFCWYAGALGDDCNTTCAAQGKVYDPATLSYAGSGGTDANCSAVASALGLAAFSSTGSAGGVGCTEYAGAITLRDLDATTASAANLALRRACACQ